ncbi:MAG: hypothetical protein AB8B55_20980 [Mariniblastus sp.]
MPSLKETAWAIVFITLASAILIFAVAQLGNSGWADSVRADALAGGKGGHGHAYSETGKSFSPLIFIAIVAGSLLKIVFALGIPGLITLGVLRFTRRKRKRSPTVPAEN